MRKAIPLLLLMLCFSLTAVAEYMDHRGHNVDSLETVMAGVTARDIEEADDGQLANIASDLQGLMYGFNQTNGVKSEYYARMLLQIARHKGWQSAIQDAAKCIGQHFWAREQYDSAAFYYEMAMQAAEAITVDGTEEGRDKVYTQRDIDNALSQMYGTLGNLYSMMDSISVAMDYYEKAGVLFKKYGWNNSCSILYYNMGETMREAGHLKEAEAYYIESLDYSLLAQDSLAIATSYKGLGSLYLDMHKTAKAIRYLDEANLYFADHEDEELQSRMESLDYTSQVLALQKKRLILVVFLLLGLIPLAFLSYRISTGLKKNSRKGGEAATTMETNTVKGKITARPDHDIKLKPKDREVLDLISKGYTNSQIAEAMSLSPETIKWYKKRLFNLLGAANSAELVTIAKDRGLL